MSNIRPNLNLQFARTKLVDPRITFARSTTAYKTNNKGLLELAAANEPRIDYDSATLECKGLLIEGQRTNIVLYNRDLNNAAWTKSNCTAALTQVGADGVSNSASLLTASSANATCLQAVSLASSARYQTAYIKRATGTGAVSMTMDNGATWTDVTASINSASFVRCSIATQTLANPVLGFKLAASGDAVIVDFVQNENGNFASSPIATTSAAITRNADNASLSSVYASLMSNDVQGSVIAQFSTLRPADSADSFNIYSIQNADATSYIELRSSNGFTPDRVFINVVNTTSQVNTSADAMGYVSMPVGVMKSALAYAANDFACVFNNRSVAVDVSVSVPSLDRIFIGNNGASGAYLFGHIHTLQYYSKRLSNAELSGLTI